MVKNSKINTSQTVKPHTKFQNKNHPKQNLNPPPKSKKAPPTIINQIISSPHNIHEQLITDANRTEFYRISLYQNPSS